MIRVHSRRLRRARRSRHRSRRPAGGYVRFAVRSQVECAPGPRPAARNLAPIAAVRVGRRRLPKACGRGEASTLRLGGLWRFCKANAPVCGPWTGGPMDKLAHRPLTTGFSLAATRTRSRRRGRPARTVAVPRSACGLSTSAGQLQLAYRACLRFRRAHALAVVSRTERGRPRDGFSSSNGQEFQLMGA